MTSNVYNIACKNYLRKRITRFLYVFLYENNKKTNLCGNKWQIVLTYILVYFNLQLKTTVLFWRPQDMHTHTYILKCV